MPRKKKEEKQKKVLFYQAVGRRKTATARVRLYPVVDKKISIGSLNLSAGEMLVNGKPIEKYFPGEIFKKLYLEPFKLTNNIGRFAATIKVKGSGLKGQLGAVVHGIARALCQVDQKTYRQVLKTAGLLTRDPRMKERRKPGLAGKARKAKQSPKR